MASTGWVLCGTATDKAGGNKAWSTLSNLTIDDTSEATCLSLSYRFDRTNIIEATNFAWSIPTGSTLDGIEFRHEVRADNDMVRRQIFLVIGGVVTTRRLNALTGTGLNSTSTVYTEGSSSNTGTIGTEPTIAELNASNFGIQTYYEEDGGRSGDSTWVRRMWMQITYTPPAAASDTSGGFFTLIGA